MMASPPQVVESLVLNVLGGALPVAVIKAGEWIRHSLRHRRFREVFGQDNQFRLVYAVLNAAGTAVYKKNVGENGAKLTVERPVSSCEMRAACYLAEAWGIELHTSVLLTADEHVEKMRDLSFISVGSLHSNLVSKFALGDTSNLLVTFSEWREEGNDTGFKTDLIWAVEKTSLNLQSGRDYGLILKLRPEKYNKRVWIVCGGIGEWGTSGAAHYLAHEWRRIQRYAGTKPFAIVVRVEPKVDESAIPVQWAKGDRFSGVAKNSKGPLGIPLRS
jgi:hypothetical protein